MRNHCQYVISGLLALAAAGPLQADDQWQNTITPYAFFSGMDGTVGVGPVTADVNVSFGDILSNLKLGGMLAYEGRKGPYSIAFDGIYMKLQADKTGPQGVISGDAKIQQSVIEVDGGYDVMEHVTVFAGLRYNGIYVNLKAQGNSPLDIVKTGSGYETWLDPVIGAHAEYPFAPHWTAGLRGDIGGFGLGSNFAWQAVGSITWQPTKLIGVTGTYRYFQQDYESGGGTNFFKYDLAVSGPQLGVSFTF